MRVLLAKGRIDHEAESTFADLVTKKPPYYFFSWISQDLEPACRKKGWDVEIVSVGHPKPQPLRIPDVLVNLITEPLICRRALDRLESTLRVQRTPIVNEVEAIRRSARTALPQVIRSGNAERVHVPLATRFSGTREDLLAHIETAGHRWPVLIRPVGMHGSRGLEKIDSPSQTRMLQNVPSDIVVSDFVDFRSGDGLYRKYRMIWVDGMIFRRHIIPSLDWNVTGLSRLAMLERPHTIKAEKEFLASVGDDLDKRVAELFRIVGLDFGVIDFAVSDTGEIIVFELNGTFQVTGSIPKEYERYQADLAYLEANNGAILDALIVLIERRAGKRIN